MGTTFVSIVQLPVVTLAATGDFIGTGATFNLPGPVTLASSAVSGRVINAAFPLLAIQFLTSAGLVPGAALSAVFNTPAQQLAANLVSLADLTAAFGLPVVTLTTSFRTGGLLSAAPPLPVLTLAGFILSEATFSAVFNLPPEQLSAELVALIAAAYRTWVLNARKGALTEYDNFNFNSYALFNGQVLACGPGGVVTLGVQGLDDTTPIVASLRTGLDDFGVSVHKRVPRIYHDGAQAGDVQFKAITVEGGTRTYLLPWNNISGHTQRRVPVGKGPRSRFWQFGVDNVAGSDFSTSSLMVYPQKLRRRVS